MSQDKRESILVRLQAVLETVVGEGHVFRNQVNVPESKLPAIQIFDADETADEDAYGRGRPANGPVKVDMTPEIYVIDSADPQDVGTAVNTMRAAVIKAVLTDTLLLELCQNGDVRYIGCATALAKGRDMNGELGIAFMFKYVLQPTKL